MSRSQRRPSLVPAALAASFALGLSFFAIAAAYVALLMLYSAMLKHIVILDVLTIAAASRCARRGRRSHSRANQPLAAHLPGMLSLFIALSKRRHEHPSDRLSDRSAAANPERLPARSDDFGRHRVDPRRLRIYTIGRNDREVRHRSLNDRVPCGDLSLSLSGRCSSRVAARPMLVMTGLAHLRPLGALVILIIYR